MKKIPLSDIPIYQTFIDHRDRALEKILHVHLTAIDGIVGKLKSKTLALCTLAHARDALRVNSGGPIRREFDLAAMQIAELTRRMRAETYLLAHVGEAEAIGRVFGKAQKINARTKDAQAVPMPSGGTVDERIQIGVDKLRRQVEEALQLSHVLRSPQAEMLDRVERAFPKTRGKISKTPALSKKRRLKEARVSHMRPELTFGFYDEDLWGEILEDYTAEVLPPNIYRRGPDDKTIFYDAEADEEQERYAWEVEQEVTEDFVRQVRSGAKDAANENDIQDFIWVAILDDKTDDCCFVRNGMSSSEIENALDDGKLDDDECDAIVAPAHFNCRCKSVPYVGEIPDVPQVDYAGFDDWLKEKAAS